MPKQKPLLLKARIHKDLMPYRDHFWEGMTLFALSGRHAERYTPEDLCPQNRRTFTRTLSSQEKSYFNEVRAAYAGTKVALIESFLLATARFRDPDHFPLVRTEPKGDEHEA